MDHPACTHSAAWTTSGTSSGTNEPVREWQQGLCSRCNAFAIFHDGRWKFSEPPLRVLQLHAEVHWLRAHLKAATAGAERI